MIPARLLAFLIQPMLALLLLAGVPAVEPDRQGQRVQVVERLLVLATASHGDAAEWRQDEGTATERFDGDDGPDPAVFLPTRPRFIVRADGIAVGCDFDATAPPRHRVCAAPPTGPPSSDA